MTDTPNASPLIDPSPRRAKLDLILLILPRSALFPPAIRRHGLSEERARVTGEITERHSPEPSA